MHLLRAHRQATVMDEIIAKIGPEQSIELVKYHAGKTASLGHMTPQDGAYLARGMLACAAALCGPDPPLVGTVIADAPLPVVQWAVRPSDGDDFVLTVTIQSGIDLTFRVPRSSEKKSL
jgi:hypothetical protein